MLRLVRPKAAGAVAALTAAVGGALALPTDGAQAAPSVKHVFVINLENKGYEQTFGASSPAPYLCRPGQMRPSDYLEELSRLVVTHS
ncbi:hypothetical protein [Micromonospora chersina]|uniref:hypothetical protein n=1 Tax=Micromonospora chersina TaxID=47854 RepID=UPI00371B2964